MLKHLLIANVVMLSIFSCGFMAHKKMKKQEIAYSQVQANIPVLTQSTDTCPNGLCNPSDGESSVDAFIKKVGGGNYLNLPSGANQMNCGGTIRRIGVPPESNATVNGYHTETYATVKGDEHLSVPNGYHTQFACGEYRIVPDGYEVKCSGGVCTLIKK